MKYKILINRKKNALVNDLFTHTELYLDCMSTSDIWEDLEKHLEMFRPDAYLCFLDSFDDVLISHLNEIRDHAKYNDIMFIMLGDPEAVDIFQKKAPSLRAAFIIMPIAIRALEAEIVKICDHERRVREEEKARIEEEKRKAEEAARLAEEARIMEEIEKRKQAEEQRKAEELKKAEEAKASRATSGAKPHILVVDDDRNVLKMLKAALEDTYEVTTIVNGTMVERFLNSRMCDLVLLDYEMPLMTGPEVFKVIRSKSAFDDVPIVFLTGVSDSAKIMEVMALKPSGYLLKPIDMERLRDTVEKLI